MTRLRWSAALAVLLLLCMVCSTHAGAVQDAAKDDVPLTTDTVHSAKHRNDQIIVRFRGEIPADRPGAAGSPASVHARSGTRVFLDLSGAGLPGTHLVGLSPGQSVADVVSFYSRQPEVLYAEPDYLVHATAMPNDPLLSNVWGLHNTGQSGGVIDADIDAPEGWDISTGSSSVVVAVVDTGIDSTHPDLAGNLWTNPGEVPGNGIDDDGNGYIDDVHGWDFRNGDNAPRDDNGHGSHTAGTIAAVGNNGIGMTGVAWKARIMPLKFLDATGNGYISDAVRAIQYANANGAHVISNSWGGGGYSQTLRDAIAASPAVVICAAGNAGTNNDVTPFYPASYRTPQTIAVAATDRSDRLANSPGWWSSNYGLSTVDCAAPGVDIYSTVPGGYGWMSGTSMATPYVAGTAALMKAAYPDLSTAQIRAAILGNVETLPDLAGKVSTGGRINIERSLAAAAVSAGFSANVTTGSPPLAVQFGDRSMGTITSRLWSFGDGTTSTLKNPVHVYSGSTAARFTVTLTVANAYRQSTSRQEGYITITPSNTQKPDLVVTRFYTSPAVPTSGSQVTFRATVKNIGTAATPAGVIHHVTFYVDGSAVAWANTFSSSIPPGSSFTVSANSGPAGAPTWTARTGSHAVMIFVDGNNRIAETNETNNKFSQSITVP